MRIDLTEGEVRQLTSTFYHGASKPLSLNTSPRDAQSRTWWTSNPRPEYIDGVRKLGALRLYLELGARALNPLQNAFPAAFDLQDGVRLRPDKGVIKACMRDEQVLLQCLDVAGELTFQLTLEGLRKLNRVS